MAGVDWDGIGAGSSRHRDRDVSLGRISGELFAEHEEPQPDENPVGHFYFRRIPQKHQARLMSLSFHCRSRCKRLLYNSKKGIATKSLKRSGTALNAISLVFTDYPARRIF